METLDRFVRRSRGLEPAGFVRAKALRVPVGLEGPTEVLRAAHASAMERLRGRPSTPASHLGRDACEAVSLLDLKAELAARLLAPCRLCALECGVDRTKGPAGACALGPGVARYLDFVHEGEEPEISPTHAILLAGCSYRCVYCSDWEHVDEPRDPETATAELARSIEARRSQGVSSVSFIGGEPLVNVPGILRALAAASASVPVVFTSNMHAGSETLDLLEGIVDAWVADLKHGNDLCAREVARAPRYLETVLPAIERVSREAFTIVRHLVLPGHVECCTIPALERLRGLDVRVNVMEQYRPTPNVRGTALDRRPTAEELARARAVAESLGLCVGPLSFNPPATPGPDPVVFGSGIWIDEDGKVTVENLSSDLAGLMDSLG